MYMAIVWVGSWPLRSKETKAMGRIELTVHSRAILKIVKPMYSGEHGISHTLDISLS
jgi:hypothetical protein